MHADQRAAAERFLSRRDPVLRKLIREVGPCGLRPRRKPAFQVLATAIVSQQLSVKAADTIQRRVETHLGGPLTPAGLAAADPLALRACGLSQAKARWLIALGTEAIEGRLNFRRIGRLDDAAAIAELDALPGIGRWTAEMFLMFALGRPDIFSLGDVGLRNGLNRLYNGGVPLSDANTLAITDTWAPWRSVASWYLWRAADVVPV